MVRMQEHHRPRGVNTRQAERLTTTLVKDGSILYVFPGSIAQARTEGIAALRGQMFSRGSGVADAPLEGASVVWMDDIPYLFPRSLTAASDVGKGYKRQWGYGQRMLQRAERRAVEGFVRQYGSGIGEGNDRDKDAGHKR